MSKKKITLLITSCFIAVLSAFAQQEQKAPTPEELAEKETDRLERVLDLEDWQVFYVDSTLVHNYTQMKTELEKMSKARVENLELYYDVQDKWTEATQTSYKKIFTAAQWELYLKQGGSRIIKDREKRRARMEKKKK